MIKSNELRIGNYIDYVGISKILELHSNEKKYDNVYLECEESFEWSEYNNIKPIPLTEQWLFDLGFEKMLNQYKKITEVNTRNGNNCPFIILDLDGFEYDDLRFQTKLHYLHQLQNFYFDLTGEELTLNNR